MSSDVLFRWLVDASRTVRKEKYTPESVSNYRSNRRRDNCQRSTDLALRTQHHCRRSGTSVTWGPSSSPSFNVRATTGHWASPIRLELTSIPRRRGLEFSWAVPFVPGTLYQICVFDVNGVPGGCQDTYTVIPNFNGTDDVLNRPNISAQIHQSNLIRGRLHSLLKLQLPAFAPAIQLDIEYSGTDYMDRVTSKFRVIVKGHAVLCWSHAFGGGGGWSNGLSRSSNNVRSLLDSPCSFFSRVGGLFEVTVTWESGAPIHRLHFATWQYIGPPDEYQSESFPQQVIVLHRDGRRAPVMTLYEEDIVELPSGSWGEAAG
ncbi:hypothetical protein BDZ89DRAFT_1112764 [Hymenopellis radicata]|nr:hypothetical protein BDZ89DRAFT_1112764 [Hymenopellis radicata]